MNITITGVNDPPVLTLPGPDPVSYASGGTPVLDASAELTDIDSAISTAEALASISPLIATIAI
ncbi:MAG: hypothetical protein R3F53_28950 [Gammaproteobacteria bacterium]